MPELPDVELYLEAIAARTLGQPLEAVRLGSPFLLRTVDPPLSVATGGTVTQLKRVGKRIAIGIEDRCWLVIHLMIAGRLHWKRRGIKVGGRNQLAAFDFPNGTLLLTEAGTKRRASLHVVAPDALHTLDPGGIDVLTCSFDDFRHQLTKENHTLKRSLTDPRLFSGIGNAYSDEILHHAKLSPVALSQKLNEDDLKRLLHSTREVLTMWVDKLRAEAAGTFPEHVTAFRDDMAVHGKFDQPCPVCGAKVQRIRYADNETNYCARCQTGGRVLADRGLSRLLGADWPRSLDDE